MINSKRLLKKNKENFDIKEKIILEYYKYEKILKELKYNDINYELKLIKQFVDKIAVWYEFKFPDSKINKIFSNGNLELNTSFFASDTDVLYDTHSFFKRYLDGESRRLKKAKYPKILDITGTGNGHFHLTNKGIIEGADSFYQYKDCLIKDYGKFLEGVHVSNAKFVAEIEGYNLSDEDNIIEKTVNKYHASLKLREILLNIILYKIIERGGHRIGPKRGLLFAKEFNLNMDIPMTYGIDSSDYHNKDFIKIYLINGGHKDLNIFINYFYEDSFEFITIKEYIDKYYRKENDFYTKEELIELKKHLITRLTKCLKNREKTLTLKK